MKKAPKPCSQAIATGLKSWKGGIWGLGWGWVEGLHQGNGEVVCIGREMQAEPASLVEIKEGGKKTK